MAMILGKKIGMTQIYDESGKMIPVTVILAGPCKVMQIKTAETDGYSAVQLGYDDVKASRIKKPQEGHAKESKTTPKRFVRELRLLNDKAIECEVGDDVTVEAFADIKSAIQFHMETFGSDNQ